MASFDFLIVIIFLQRKNQSKAGSLQKDFKHIKKNDLFYQFGSKEAIGWLVPDRALVVDHPLDCIEALPLVWDVEGLKDVWEGGVVPADPGYRSLQVKEALLLQRGKETKQNSCCWFKTIHLIPQFWLIT